MPKLKKPPTVTTHHIKAIIKFLNLSRRPHYAIYYELLAYPGIKGTALRNLKWKDIDKKECTVLGMRVLPGTMKRLWKYCKIKGAINSNRKLFLFTKQRAHDIWLECLKKVKLPKGTTMWDYKMGYRLFLMTQTSTKKNGKEK